MVYHLTFEDMNELLKPQIMSPSDQLSHAPNIANHVLPSPQLHLNNISAARSACSLSDNSNILMQCMQKLAGHYPSSNNSRVVLQESCKGQMMMSASSGDDGQQAGSAAATAAAGSGSCTPRPRWCPTPEQIQVLEALFNSGTTTPSRDMIVEIAGCLKQFGSIVEANVFYWFQNRKARAKRKLRMQAQLQQQQAAGATSASGRSSPTNSINDCPSSQFPRKSSCTTSRRVCAKTASKTSPATADHYPPPHELVHLSAGPPPAHHSDDPHYHLDHQLAAVTCSNFNVHDLHHHDPLAATAACAGLIIDQAQALPTMISNASSSSCRMNISSSNPERRALCTLSNTDTTSAGNHFDDKLPAHNHVMSQSTIASSGRPAVLSLIGDNRPDHHYSPTQNNNECGGYPHLSSSYLPAIVSVTSSSRPGSAGSNDVMAGSSCSPKSVVESQYNQSASLFQTPPSTFLVASATEGAYSNLREAINPNYSTLALSHNPSAVLYHNTVQEGLSLSNKRNWMDALIQQFNVSQTAASSQCTHHNCNISTPSNTMHDPYDLDCQAKMLNIKHDEEDHTPNIELSLVQLQRAHTNSSQGALMMNNTSSLTNHDLSTDCNMVPGTQLIDFVIKENNQNASVTTAVCSKKHKVTSSASEAFHHELYIGQDNKRKDQANLESLICSSTSTTPQQYLEQDNNVAFSTTSPLRVIHHCDNLPLWEALAPYMSIGS